MGPISTFNIQLLCVFIGDCGNGSKNKTGGHLTTPSTWPGKGTRGAVAELIFIFFTKTVLPFHSYEIMMHSQQTNRDLCKFTLKDQFQFLVLCASEEVYPKASCFSWLLTMTQETSVGTAKGGQWVKAKKISQETSAGSTKMGLLSQSKSTIQILIFQIVRMEAEEEGFVEVGFCQKKIWNANFNFCFADCRQRTGRGG